jgi:RNA polymerase sigma-70 factor (ECF subfamily)
VNSPRSESSRWFAEEVQPHEPALRAYLRQRFPGVNDADDLVQESYIRLLGARRRAPIANAKAYLFTIAGNLARTFLRRSRLYSPKSLSSAEAVAVADERHDVTAQVTSRQETAILLDAIDALPRRCREIFILIKLQGLSHQDVADRLGLSVQTVHVQVVRGIHKCTLYLRKQGVGEGGRP